MKTVQSVLVAAAVAIGMAVPASAGINDPEVIIYRFPGVTDNGNGPGFGVATVFHCTNFSGANENIRFVTRRNDGVLVSNQVFTFPHLSTGTLSTHITAAYMQSADLSAQPVTQGTTAIAATSINVICTAETIDASTVAPVGVARRGIRFNPVPGSEE